MEPTEFGLFPTLSKNNWKINNRNQTTKRWSAYVQRRSFALFQVDTRILFHLFLTLSLWSWCFKLLHFNADDDPPRTQEGCPSFSSLILVDVGFKERSALRQSPARVLGNGLRWKEKEIRGDECLNQTPEWYIFPAALNQLTEPHDKWQALIIRQGSDSCLNYDWITTG